MPAEAKRFRERRNTLLGATSPLLGATSSLLGATSSLVGVTNPVLGQLATHVRRPCVCMVVVVCSSTIPRNLHLPRGRGCGGA